MAPDRIVDRRGRCGVGTVVGSLTTFPRSVEPHNLTEPGDRTSVV
jgi:hypothetical protein